MGDLRSWVLLALSCWLPARVVAESNTGYWTDKLARNKSRDADKIAALEARGFRVLVVWECDVRDGARLKEELTAFFMSDSR
jgi:DNA mismatch endonuclease, patch repair protein